MKQFSWVLAVCLVFLAAVPAAAAEPFHYESEALGFSLTVPGLSGGEITAEEGETGVRFYHAPSRERFGGLIGTLEVVSPRSAFFSEAYTHPAYRILAVGEDRMFLWKSPGDGANSGADLLEAFSQASSALSVERLRECLTPVRPDALPRLREERHLAYLPVEGGLLRPDDAVTRGEMAQMLYALLEADNKDRLFDAGFSDIAGADCARAVNYLGSYGILSGYPDGTFRPESPVSRAQCAVLLHRCQFAVPVGRYGDTADFADVPEGSWAEDFLYSARILGWMTGDAGGEFHPDREITRAEAVTAINRMLGRDESCTPVEAGANPFSDLDAGHWAYGNLLEAAGVLRGGAPAVPQSGALPEGSSAYAFLSGSEGWAAGAGRLRRTVDGGRTWEEVGDPLSLTVSGLYFFNSREGVLLGSGRETPWALLQTDDGGETWRPFPDGFAQNSHFPAAQFPDERRLLAAVVSAELRPAGGDAVYLTVRYRPYESIYTCDLEAVMQTVITAEEIVPPAQ